MQTVHTVDKHETLGQGNCVVGPGDTLSRIAEREGLLPATIWDDPKNAELRCARGEDGEILLPGDRLTIRPKRCGTESCRTGAVHRFRRKGVPAKLRVVVESYGGEPRANKRYVLTVGDAVHEGTTGPQGEVAHWVSPRERNAVLEVWVEEEPEEIESYDLDIGELAPLDTVAGVQTRLRNLGYLGYAREDDLGSLGETTRDAIRRFRFDHDLPEGDGIDETLRAALRDEHGV